MRIDKANSPTITVSRAAMAAGLTDATLRNWLDRGQVTLDADSSRVGRGWRRFSVFDVLRLAIMGRIVSYGFDVPTADAMLVQHFDADKLTLAGVGGVIPDLDAFAAVRLRFSTRMMIVCHDGRVASLDGGLPHETMFRVSALGAEPGGNSGWTAHRGSEWFIRDTPEDFIIIRLGAVADGVLARLGEEG